MMEARSPQSPRPAQRTFPAKSRESAPKASSSIPARMSACALIRREGDGADLTRTRAAAPSARASQAARLSEVMSQEFRHVGVADQLAGVPHGRRSGRKRGFDLAPCRRQNETRVTLAKDLRERTHGADSQAVGKAVAEPQRGLRAPHSIRKRAAAADDDLRTHRPQDARADEIEIAATHDAAAELDDDRRRAVVHRGIMRRAPPSLDARRALQPPPRTAIAGRAGASCLARGKGCRGTRGYRA